VSQHYEKAMLLFEQERWELALENFHAALEEDPTDGVAMAYTALCLMRMERLAEATEAAQAAVTTSPDKAWPLYALACVYDERNRFQEAEKTIGQAIELEPENPGYLAFLAGLRAHRKEWKQALEIANRALELNPNHVGAAHYRAYALVGLGRAAQAREFLSSALGRDPENPLYHANLGWTALEQGDRETAMAAFQEALRLEPELEWAREGLVEALKLQYPFYGLMLRWMLKLKKYGKTQQLAIIYGEYLITRWLMRLARRSKRLRLLVNIIFLLNFLFTVLSWAAEPLTSLLLRFNPYGRASLSEDQLRASTYAGGAACPALLCGAGFLMFKSVPMLVAFFVFVMALMNVGAAFQCHPGRPRQVVGAAGWAALLVGLFAVYKIALWNPDWTGWGALTLSLNISFLGRMLSNVLSGYQPPK